MLVPYRPRELRAEDPPPRADPDELCPPPKDPRPCGAEKERGAELPRESAEYERGAENPRPSNDPPRSTRGDHSLGAARDPSNDRPIERSSDRIAGGLSANRLLIGARSCENDRGALEGGRSMLRGEDCRSNDRGELEGGRSIRGEDPRGSGAVRGARSIPLILSGASPREADGGRSARFTRVPRSAGAFIGRDSSRPRATGARSAGLLMRSFIPGEALGGRSLRNRSFGRIRAFPASRGPRAASGVPNRPFGRSAVCGRSPCCETCAGPGMGLPFLPSRVPPPIAGRVLNPAFGAGVARDTTARSRTAAGGTRPAPPAPRRLRTVGFTSARFCTRARASSLVGTRTAARPTACPFTNTFRGTAVTAPATRAFTKFTLRMFPLWMMLMLRMRVFVMLMLVMNTRLA